LIPLSFHGCDIDGKETTLHWPARRSGAAHSLKLIVGPMLALALTG